MWNIILRFYGDNIAKEAEEKGRLEGIISMIEMCKEFNM